MVSKYLQIEFQSKKIKYEERFELNVFLEWNYLSKRKGITQLHLEKLLYNAMLR